MPKVRWVMSYGFCSKFHTLSSSAKNFENRLRFDKVTDSLKVGTFLRLSVERVFSIFMLLLACGLPDMLPVTISPAHQQKATASLQAPAVT